MRQYIRLTAHKEGTNTRVVEKRFLDELVKPIDMVKLRTLVGQHIDAANMITQES